MKKRKQMWAISKVLSCAITVKTGSMTAISRFSEGLNWSRTEDLHLVIDYNEFISLRRLFYPNSRALPGSAGAQMHAREERLSASTQECRWANWANQVKKKCSQRSALSLKCNANSRIGRSIFLCACADERSSTSGDKRYRKEQVAAKLEDKESHATWNGMHRRRGKRRFFTDDLSQAFVTHRDYINIEMEAFRKLHAYLTHLCALVWSLCSHFSNPQIIGSYEYEEGVYRTAYGH